MTPKVGDYFEHSQWLDPDRGNRPLICKITKIERGLLYYRGFYGTDRDGRDVFGAPGYFPFASVPIYVAKVLEGKPS